ncbi:hypothetical protein BJ165DRAFT_1410070 [Panaeolus papilionaceus]|nr:hypothetical protein BJ165DRAFT_1410070 [Panaeolus papilionaceus]
MSSVTCQYCPRICNSRGIKSHERACAQNPANAKDDMPELTHEQHALLALLEYEEQTWNAAMHQAISNSNHAPPSGASAGPHPDPETEASDLALYLLDNTSDSETRAQDINASGSEGIDTAPAATLALDSSGAAANARQPELSVPHVKVEKHPHCKENAITMTLVQYREMETQMDEARSALNEVDERPWRPFRTRLDFEIADLMLETHMNRRQVDTAISLIHQAIGDRFEEFKFTVPYCGQDMEYSVWSHSAEQWCRELLTNKNIVSHFQWDAQRVYHRGNSSQANFGGNSRLYLNFIIAIWLWFTTRLSSFGNTKGHPVLVRCVNLPVEIRNGEGVGGGRLIGWLPILPEISSESGKQGFIRHKQEVWHEAMSQIFKSLADWMELGTAIQLVMISADYKEQSDMALTRSSRAHLPCPVCLVFKCDIPKVTQKALARTTESMESLWTEVQEYTAAHREDSLQAVGLRDVQNTFWSLKDTDVYSALSWDCLHAYHGGLFSDHLLEELKEIVDDLPGRQVEIEIDRCLMGIPPWQGLNRFTSIHSTGEMSDGSKFEDFGKVIIYAALGCITLDVSTRGFTLLKLIRSYQELDQFTGLTLQSERTLREGWEELKMFKSLLAEYSQIHDSKEWDFPKVHTHQHVFDDIRNKGVTRNYNTKPGEKSNGPLKKFYQNHTNFKNIAPQILKNEQDNIKDAELIGPAAENPTSQGQDQTQQTLRTNEVDPEPRAPPEVSTATREEQGSTALPHVTFRSRLPGLSLEAIVQGHAEDDAFSMDILRVNPNFHGHAHFDFAILNVDSKMRTAVIVQLLFVFQITYRVHNFELALVQHIEGVAKEWTIWCSGQLRQRTRMGRPDASTKEARV